MAAVIAGSRSSADVSEEEIDVLLRVNVKGSFEAVQACAPAMSEAGHGSVVLVSSVAAHRARSGSPLYGATKAAVIRLTQQLAWEHGPSGIRVNCISPGQTPTQLTAWDAAPSAAPAVAKVAGNGGVPDTSSAAGKAARLPLRRRGTASDYVGPVLFLLSDLAAYVTGVDIPVDGGLVATMQ
jgi:NAD(P)-dependent dehydrogenase (short-subunit alcohol dehydrogenase family)